VIVVLSDGDDTARIADLHSRGNSKLSALQNQVRFIERVQADVVREIQRGEVTFYSINPSGRTMHLNVRIARSQIGMESWRRPPAVRRSCRPANQIYRRFFSGLRRKFAASTCFSTTLTTSQAELFGASR